MTDTVDAVVVGAGHNGLVAANLLADAGWDVLLCEASDAPGGAVRTAEITAPGFRSDLASAFHPLGAASPVLRELDLPSYGLVWRHAPAVVAHPTADGRCAVLHRSLDDTAAALDTDHPGDGDAWRAMVAEWDAIGTDVLEAALRPFPPVRAASRLWRRLGTGDTLRLARTLLQPVARMAAERFGGTAAPLLLAGNALHTDLGPDNAASAAYGWLLAMLGQRIGFPVPAGGSGALTDALVARFTARGGRLDVGRPVTSVLVEGGRATGVLDAHGGRVLARRAVLADVDAPRLYRDLVGEEHLPARFVADLDRFQWDFSTVKIDWALDRPVPWTALSARSAGTVHVGADVDGLRRYASDLSAGRLPGEPFLLFGQMTTADPDRSPPGTESAWAYTHVPRGLGWGRDDVLRWADRMERVVEDHAPGFTGLVRARSVAGPADLQDYDGNLVDGAITAGTCAPHQQLVFRPTPGLGRADTPVDRLFLSGASAHPGGAVHGGPGANAARAALAASGPAGPLYRGAVRFAHRRIHG
ncbi:MULTISPECIES: phytoene desaturase family protein [Pseudonocardia]|uniref:phytoene desaturase family protein n=1 Tax=Pseudonocardia TaxID=1847 RepID=UPI001AD7C498|nr:MULTISPECIES: NAD(P)/FAD-dependent oxidoreductase [Pseudonocardia]MBO4236184.1 NAD(P)-binding protein [Pseudonocardia alni]